MEMDSLLKGQISVVAKRNETPKRKLGITEHGNCKNTLMKSPILEACAYGQLDTIERLLEEGADACIKSYCGRTALHEACMGGHIDCLERLLELQCDVDAQDSEGLTAAHIAAFNGEEECLRTLATKGANLMLGDKHGRLAIHLAAIRSHCQILHLLCHDYRISYHVTCNLGKTPLHYSAQHGSLQCLKYLVQRGCGVNLVDNLGFWAAQYAARYNRLDCLRYLLEQGTSVNCARKDNKTLLHVAGFYGSLNVLHWLLEHGADPNIQDGELESVCNRVIGYLLRVIRKTNMVFGLCGYNDLGNTVGHQSALKGKPECYSCFLNHGGNPELINLTNDNPMGTAKRAGHVLLLQKAVNKEILCPLCENISKKKERMNANSSKESAFLSSRRNTRTSLPPPLPKGQTFLELYAKCKWKGEPIQSKSTKNLEFPALQRSPLTKTLSCISLRNLAPKNSVDPSDLFTFSIRKSQ